MNEVSAVTIGIAAGLVSAAAIWFAFLHWRAAEAKRRNDLFEPRFEVYIEFWQEAHAILQVGPPDETRRYRLLILLQKARFLFSEDIYRYLQQFVERADELSRSEYVGADAGVDQSQASKARMDNLLWFDQQAEEIARRFRPYLSAETPRSGPKKRASPPPNLLKPPKPAPTVNGSEKSPSKNTSR